MPTVKRTEKGKKRAAEIRLQYNKFAYENVGIRYKRGVSKVLNCIAEDMGFSLSGLFREALDFYIKEKLGKNILEDDGFNFDIDMYMNIIHILNNEEVKSMPDGIDKTKNVYIPADNFQPLAYNRAEAEKRFGKDNVLSEKDFNDLFEYNKETDGYYTKKTTLDIIYKYLYFLYK